MALFLSEAVNNYERKQVTRGSTDLTEATMMLLSISEQSASLTEAVMTAEFTLMRQCRNLSESETSNKMKDFGKKVWHNLKAFAKTVWAKIKEICRMVWRKLKEWGSQVLDMFSGKEMEIKKEDLHFLEESPRLIERMLFIIEKGINASEDAADSFKEKADDIERDWKELMQEHEKQHKASFNSNKERDEKKGYMRVGKNWLKSVTNTIKGHASKLEKFTDDAEKRIEAIEKIENRMSDDDNKGDMGKAAATYKTAMGIAKNVASGILKATSAITEVGRAVAKDEISEESSAKKQGEINKQIEALALPGKGNKVFNTTNDDLVAASFSSENLPKAQSLFAKRQDIISKSAELARSRDEDTKGIYSTYKDK